MPFSTDSGKKRERKPSLLIHSYFFKQRAKTALQGDWQTPLLVTLTASIFILVANLLTQTGLRSVQAASESFYYALSGIPENGIVTLTQLQQLREVYLKLLNAIQSIPTSTWIGIIVADISAVLLTPIFSVCACHYYLCRLDGETPSIWKGVSGRLSIWYKSLGLYALMAVKILAWSLLLVVPGIIAFCRYSMAPYFLADDPKLSPLQAIAKSKQVMAHTKLSYFLLRISFVLLLLIVSILQMLISGISPVVGLVVSLFGELVISTYSEASCAAFYQAVGHSKGIFSLVEIVKKRMREAGMPEEEIDNVTRSASEVGKAIHDDLEDEDTSDDGTDQSAEKPDADSAEDESKDETLD